MGTNQWQFGAYDNIKGVTAYLWSHSTKHKMKAFQKLFDESGQSISIVNLCRQALNAKKCS